MNPVDSIWLSVLYGFPAIFGIAVILAALAFAMLKRSRFPRPGNMLLLGLICMLLARFVGIGGGFLISRQLGIEAVTIAMGYLNVFTAMFYFVGLGLVIGAVFVDRNPLPSKDRLVSAAPPIPDTDSNPFKTPLAS